MTSWVRSDDHFYTPARPLLCPLFGESIPVSIHTDGAEIQQDQLVALSRFLEIPADQRGLLTLPLFDDYRTIKDAVGEGPEIDTPESVWQHVKWTTLLVPRQGPLGNRYVFVIGDPDWEEEHGVELLFRDERLVRLDRAEGAFLGKFWELG